MTNTILAEQAIAAWRRAFATGQFETLIALLDDTVQFRFGMAPYHVTQHGKARCMEAIEFLRECEIRVEQHPIAPTMHGVASSGFEFKARGTVRGKAVEADFIVIFDFANGRIARLCEYTPPAG